MSEAEAKPKKPVKRIVTPVSVTYTFTPGAAGSKFLRAIGEGRILGQKCERCGKVYVPPRGACARCGVAVREEVEVSDKGTVVSFAIVRVPSEGIDIELPFVSATILLDGADIPMFHLVRDVDVEEVRMGMRVEAVWKPEDEWTASLDSILHFRPTGEADVPLEQIEEHQ